MTCTLCSGLVVDYSKVVKNEIPVPFTVEEVYPGLFQLRRNGHDGCEFCYLLAQLMSEYFDVTECALDKPVHFLLSNARFFVESREKILGEDFEKSAKNGVTFLVMELSYEGRPKPRDMVFAVCSNNDRE